MGTRGRKSAASLTVAAVASVEIVQRPDAPYDLTDEQAEEWWAVVNRVPADWFPRETHGMLAQYCRHVVAARRVSEMIRVLEEEVASAEKEKGRATAVLSAAKAFDRLLKMQEREGRAISSLATRMRLTQQSTYDPKRKKPIEEQDPWDDTG